MQGQYYWFSWFQTDFKAIVLIVLHKDHHTSTPTLLLLYSGGWEGGGGEGMRTHVSGEGTDQTYSPLTLHILHTHTHTHTANQLSLHSLRLGKLQINLNIWLINWTKKSWSYWLRWCICDRILQIFQWYQIKWKGGLSWAGCNNRPHSLLPWCFTFCTLAHINGWKHQCLAIAHV